MVRLDDILQPIRRKSATADEFDRLDAGFFASVIVKTRSTRLFGCSMILDRCGRHSGRSGDRFRRFVGVGLNHRTGQRAAPLYFARKLLVLDLLVALEGNAADHRVCLTRSPPQRGREARTAFAINYDGNPDQDGRPAGPALQVSRLQSWYTSRHSNNVLVYVPTLE
jgi:hypothetical protein